MTIDPAAPGGQSLTSLATRPYDPGRRRPHSGSTPRLVGDAHTTEDLSKYGAPPPDQVIAHTNLYWKYQSAPGRRAGTVDTAEVSFTPADAG